MDSSVNFISHIQVHIRGPTTLSRCVPRPAGYRQYIWKVRGYLLLLILLLLLFKAVQGFYCLILEEADIVK